MTDTWIEGSQGERYLVRRELGRGAMGLVLLAEAAQGRLVVLKILQGATEGVAIERFAREAAVARRLDHPGIVALHHAGRLRDGRCYLCFANVEGARDLEGPFLEAPRAQRLEWLIQTGAALGHAHQQGIVHRDVKLANLLIDSAQRVRVADFGVALLSDRERLTQSGALVGTVRTMAPEQAAGKRHAIAPQTDVWALGVLLYLACEERYPFEGATQIAILQEIVAGNPRPLSDCPPALEAVVRRALQPDPALRYADGSAFAEALELATLDTSERSRSIAPLVLGVLILAVGAGVGIGLVLRSKFRAASPSPPATPSPRASAAPPQASPTPSAEDPAQLLAAAEALAKGGGAGARAAYLRAAEAGSLGAQEYLWRHEPPPERERWRQRAAESGSGSAAYELARSLQADDPVSARSWLRRAAKAGHRPAMLPLSHSLRDEGAGPVDPESADQWFAEALRLEDPSALLEQGETEYRQGRQREAVALVRQAAAAEHGAAYVRLGRWQAKGWRGVPPDLDESETSLRRALELEAPDAAGYLALTLHSQGKSREAERLLLNRVGAGDRLCQAVWGRFLYYTLGRKPEGLKLLRAAETTAPPHPEIDFALAGALNARGERQEALRLAQRSAQAGHGEAKVLLAQLYSRKGAPLQAQEILQEAFVEGVPEAALALSALATENAEKRRYLEAALELHEPTTLVTFSRYAFQAKLFTKGRDYLERAAASGDPGAHLILAQLFQAGTFGAPEPALAERHWLEAARRRDVDGAVGLAQFLAKVRPESPHLAEAKEWLEEACRRQHPKALALKTSLGW